MSQSRWDQKFLTLAIGVSDWSKDPNTKVGCIIVDNDNNILCTGYNGFPRGVVDSSPRLQDRDLKLQIIIHAEANAVAVGGRSRLMGATAYITRPPCSQCAGLLIQAGIKRIVWLRIDGETKWQANMELARIILKEAGIEIEAR